MKPPSWLYGLQDYFDFEDDFVAKLFVDQLISVYFSDNKANSVKNLCFIGIILIKDSISNK